ncbi:hypothetical protein ACQPZX_16530 [Actinoplanes sp. CA-142083]|uniref:hypothetical protein n=1 Tax=Actinoplanes sp. CA-142083 TaxID=3239903 RepID=UPI003D8C305B
MEMPQAEFDAVDYFVHERGRAPAPPPQLALYLDYDHDSLSEVFPQLLDDLAATAPGVRPVAAGWALSRSPSTGTDTWTDDTLDRVMAALRTGRLEMLQISFADSADRRLSLAVDAVPSDPAAGQGVSASSAQLWTAAEAESLLDLIAKQRGLRTAAITWDRTGLHSSAWELWYDVLPHEMVRHTRDHVRGYYWAVLLTAGHLARLPDLQQRAEAAGFVVVPLGDAFLVRDPAPIADFDDTRLAAAKELYRPVLLDREYICYQGYPLRIVRDPGTAFRKVPPGSPFPQLT